MKRGRWAAIAGLIATTTLSSLAATAHAAAPRAAPTQSDSGETPVQSANGLTPSQAAAQNAFAKQAGLQPETAAQAGVVPNPSPPSGFNPLVASDAELLRYGIPPPPPKTSPEYSAWKAAVLADTRRPIHDFRYRPTMKATPPRFGVQSANGLGGSQQTQTLNWAGNQDINGAYNEVVAEFTVPTCCVHASPSDEDSWVGSGDGFSNLDPLMQTGFTGIFVNPFPPYGEAWWEDYPNNFAQYDLGTFFNAGDVIYMAMYALDSTRSKWLFYVSDTTTSGQTMSVTTQRAERCSCSNADWIVERAYTYLANFLTINEYYGYAVDYLGNTFTAGQVFHYSIHMVSASGGDVADPKAWTDPGLYSSFPIVRGPADQPP